MRKIGVGALFITSGLFGFGPSTAAVTAPLVSHRPAIVATRVSAGWTSTNWSGYATSVSSPARSVVGHWKVPTVSATTHNTYSSSWTGIDGFTNSSLIQTGTEQDWVNGRPFYAAWWEILPAPETIIPTLTIHPGDSMSASIAQRTTTTTWDITITDVTTGQSFHTTQAYSGPGASVEWIQEAPSVNGRIAKLAHYGKTTFDMSALNGAFAVLSATNAGTMVQNGRKVSSPSLPDSDKEGFAMKYGATAPPPPAS
jgi:Peptidase A4 family